MVRILLKQGIETFYLIDSLSRIDSLFSAGVETAPVWKRLKGQGNEISFAGVPDDSPVKRYQYLVIYRIKRRYIIKSSLKKTSLVVVVAVFSSLCFLFFFLLMPYNFRLSDFCKYVII